MDEEPVDDGQVPLTAGERLRAAREAKGMSIEEIASTTRIPTRHLESLENANWTALPAPTYSIGFARNYATAVGLDRDEISDQLRSEMGNTRAVHQPTELFEPADPKRSMPKGLVIGALLALALVAVALTWLSNRDLADDSNAAVNADNAALADAGVAPIAAAPAVAGPVVITANDAAWIEVKDGTTILKQGELASGQSFEVPATATAPTLTTGKPEALRISVGTADAPAVGPAGQKIANVSLKGADLLKGPLPTAAAPPQPQPVAAPASAQAAARPTPRPVAPRLKPAPPPAPVAAAPAPAAPATNTSGA